MDWRSKATSFSREHIMDPAQLAVASAAGIILLLCLFTRLGGRCKGASSQAAATKLLASTSPPLLRLPPGTNDGIAAEFEEGEYRYNAHIAWLEGGMFMAACFIASWAAGVLDATFFHPTWPMLDASFVGFTIASFFIVFIGYWLIWPIGTVSYGRLWGWHCVLFGLIDGIAESQLFLCIWSAVELFGLPRYGTGIITFLLQGGFKANWDQKYWNVRVAPAHNVESWNKWKVLLVHVPNVLVTFSFFITYGNATLYCATQTVALIGSTSFMRFPTPYSKYTNPPLRQQVNIYAERDRAQLWCMDHWETGEA